MKRLFVIMALLFFAAACSREKEEASSPTPDEQAWDGPFGFLPPLIFMEDHPLTGEWDYVEFAYTDGHTISDVAQISKGGLKIPVTAVAHYNGELLPPTGDGWNSFHGANTYWFVCSISGNTIKLISGPSTQVYAMDPDERREESDISSALINAHSFDVKGNELLIHFTGDENKNLLIAKKR